MMKSIDHNEQRLQFCDRFWILDRPMPRLVSRDIGDTIPNSIHGAWQPVYGQVNLGNIHTYLSLFTLPTNNTIDALRSQSLRLNRSQSVCQDARATVLFEVNTLTRQSPTVLPAGFGDWLSENASNLRNKFMIGRMRDLTSNG